MMINEEHLNKALAHAADLALELSALKRSIKNMADNLTCNNFAVYILDDGTPRDVTAETVQNLQNLIK